MVLLKYRQTGQSHFFYVRHPRLYVGFIIFLVLLGLFVSTSKAAAVVPSLYFFIFAAGIRSFDFGRLAIMKVAARMQHRQVRESGSMFSGTWQVEISKKFPCCT